MCFSRWVVMFKSTPCLLPLQFCTQTLSVFVCVSLCVCLYTCRHVFVQGCQSYGFCQKLSGMCQNSGTVHMYFGPSSWHWNIWFGYFPACLNCGCLFCDWIPGWSTMFRLESLLYSVCEILSGFQEGGQTNIRPGHTCLLTPLVCVVSVCECVQLCIHICEGLMGAKGVVWGEWVGVCVCATVCLCVLNLLVRIPSCRVNDHEY